jgi:putative ABC transport system permease protein
MMTLRMALRNVLRQRKRSIMLAGAIAFGVMIITLVQSFTGGLILTANARVTEMLGGHVYVSGREVSESGRLVSVIRDRAALEEALALLDDRATTTRLRSSAFGEVIFASRTASVSITGVDWTNEPALVASLDLVAGDASAIGNPAAIMMPQPTAEELGVAVGETVLARLTTITGQQTVGEFVVGGLLRDAGLLGMEAAYAQKAYLNELIGMTDDQYQQVVISVADTSRIETIAHALESYLADRGLVAVEEPGAFGERSDEMGPAGGRAGGGALMGGLTGSFGFNVEDAERWDGTRFSVTTINDVMEPIMTIMNVLDAVALGLFLVLLAITMVGLLNTFRMILIERTREIGTIRAVGMQRIQVRNLFLLEALILALGGAIGGLLVAAVAGTVVSNVPISTEGPLVIFLDGSTFAFAINVPGVIGMLALLTVITLMSAYLPARRAAAMRPADALRTSY